MKALTLIDAEIDAFTLGICDTFSLETFELIHEGLDTVVTMSKCVIKYAYNVKTNTTYKLLNN